MKHQYSECNNGSCNYYNDGFELNCTYSEDNSKCYQYEVRKEMLDMVMAIPCICDEIYKGRGLCDPDCPKCNWIDNDIVDRFADL